MESAAVWLIDSQPLLRAGLRAQLDGKGFNVEVDAGTVDEAIRLGARGPQAKLVVLDFSLGSEAIGKLKAAQTQSRVVVFAEAAELSFLSEMFAAGADGYVLKSISPNALIESLKLVLLGEKVFPGILTNFLGALHSHNAASRTQRVQIGDVALSQRELDIIRSLADGHTNKSIAKELSITEATVKVHIKTVLRKLGAANRTQVAIWAVQHGLTNGNNGPRTRE
jgi:two-component system, NarL family, nitrate/nitrite response regulator NarL